MYTVCRLSDGLPFIHRVIKSFHLVSSVTFLAIHKFSIVTLLGGTPYEGGKFKVKLVLSKDFPASPPRGKFHCIDVIEIVLEENNFVNYCFIFIANEDVSGYFLTKVFHPNVADNGEICVNTLKKDWKPELGIKHVLMVRDGTVRSHYKCIIFVRR